MTESAGERPSAAVVGGGIGGLAAAWRLAGSHDVTVLEATDRVGGKLRLERVAGVPVDVGAEAMIARRPEGVALAREAGLDLVHPTSATSRIWSRGALRPMPRSLFGIPLDLEALAASGLLSADGLARVREERALPPATLAGDVAVGDLLEERLGAEIVDRLAEPLLGGVYAGHARRLSLRATLPQAEAMLARGLLASAEALPRPSGPVFAAVPGGMGRFPEALAASGRFAVRTDVTVRALDRDADGFVLTTGATTAEERLRADRVIVATPPAAAARLLADLAPTAAAHLAAIETASVVVVTFAMRAEDLDPALEAVTGLLVPPIEERAIKAATLSFAKWDWVRDAGRGAGPAGEDLVFLRASLGRHGDERTLQRTDADLVGTARAELAALAGIDATPVDAHVQRWGGGLPQYAVGHLDRVAAIRSDIARVPGLDVCGAAYDGVGIPAVIASAARATMGP